MREQGEQVEIKSLLSEMREERQDAEQRDREMTPKKPDRRDFDFRELHYLGALFNTYIMACDDGLIFISSTSMRRMNGCSTRSCSASVQ